MNISAASTTPSQGNSSPVPPARANGTWEPPEPAQAAGKPAGSVIDKIGKTLPEFISLASVIP